MKSFLIFLFGWYFAHSETAYFGNHWTPSCPAECVCDGIVVVVCAIGLLTAAVERIERKLK